MQDRQELLDIMQYWRSDVPLATREYWADLLSQLKGCRLYSMASPDKDKQKWLRERQVGIGGSEIAAILGENKWSSPQQVWASKVGMFDDTEAPQSEAARWGNLLESTVAAEWGHRTGRKWVHIPAILQDEAKPWMLANIDGFTLDDTGKIIQGILEVKTTSVYNKDAWEIGPLPFNYICQVTWYCGITRLDNYTIICLVGGQRLYDYDMPIDPALFAREDKEANHFWHEYVLKKIEPPLTANDLQFAKDPVVTEEPQEPVIMDEAGDRMIAAYVSIREKMNEMKKISDALKAQIRHLLQDKTEALGSTHIVVLSPRSNRSCNYMLLADKYPEVYEECVEESTSWTMMIK